MCYWGALSQAWQKMGAIVLGGKMQVFSKM